jgi:hypothetical protein
MAVILQSAVRRNPNPCMHFLATLVADGARSVDVEITTAELSDPITDDDLRSVLKVWARYQVSRGKNLGQLVGQTIFPTIP